MPAPDRPNRDIAQRENKRTPLGVSRQKLVLNELRDSKFNYRWINDKGTRIADALRGGYQFVSAEEVGTIGIRDVLATNHDLGSGVSTIVEKSNGTRAFLMKIDKELFEEDQREKQKIPDAIDAQIRGGHVPGLEGRTYTRPEHKMSVEKESG